MHIFAYQFVIAKIVLYSVIMMKRFFFIQLSCENNSHLGYIQKLLKGVFSSREFSFSSFSAFTSLKFLVICLIQDRFIV